MVNPYGRIDAGVAQEALDWFVANRGGGLSEAQRRAFGAWLTSSPLHIAEYLKTAVTSRDLQAAVHVMGAQLDSLLVGAEQDEPCRVIRFAHWGERPADPAVAWRRWFAPRRVLAVAIGIVLVLAAMVWVGRDGERFGLQKQFATAGGQSRSWRLPDGSDMSLDGDSIAIVHFTSHERLVWIEAGQALFHVTHERGRRFHVVAGEAGIIAVGTEFDVLYRPGATLVTVVRGKVAVFTGNAPSAFTSAALPAEAIAVSAGEQLQVIKGHPQPIKASAAEVLRTVAWALREISFDHEPLAAVAEQFNRYNRPPLRIEGEQLRSVPISGVFDAYDTESFVAFLRRLDGVQIERNADRILVRDSFEERAHGK